MACTLRSHLILLLFLPCIITGNNANIIIGDTLTAGNSAAPWLSPRNNFAFGFHQLEDDIFLLAVWYYKLPEKTIVWHANGDNPAPRGSQVHLNDQQGLVLISPQGTELWRSRIKSSPVSFGQMNDTGNLVLFDRNYQVVWDSFSHPTDTLLPTQIMDIGDTLSSKKSGNNFSLGSFQFRMADSGNVLLNTINLPTQLPYSPYYISGTYDPKNRTNCGFRVIFDEFGFLYILNRNGSKTYFMDSNLVLPTDKYYYRATISHDGVFIISYHSKNQTANSSWIIAHTTPENICKDLSLVNSPIGKGVCGFNSICSLKADKRPACQCPQGYSLLDSRDEYSGCTPNFDLGCQPSRKKDSQEDLYSMKALPNIDWPDSDYEIYKPYNLEDCKDSCLQDCFCVLSHFKDDTCWKKKLPLISGHNSDIIGTSFIKLMKNSSADPSNNTFQDGKKNHGTLITVISTLLGSSVFIIFILVGAICFGSFYYKNHMKNTWNFGNNSSAVETNLRNFKFKELEVATHNFRDELGRGSCGIVYKGTIATSIVAVKKLDKMLQDSDKEFKTEVNVIGQTHHKNLVRLLGFCDEGRYRILVYEFLSNGNLSSFLFNNEKKPDWKHRLQIAFGIARGLLYLHEDCYTQIIHCDIKPQNILLDEYYNAKISDFGLAKLLLVNQSRTETGIRGTKGYVAPDWFRSAPITVKVDVYSFGVMLLEIICCRKNVVEMEVGSEGKAILTDWAYDCYKAGRLDILVENDDEAINEMKRLEMFVRIAIWCLQEDHNVRPTMKNVMLMLEGIVPVTIPPDPYL